MLPKNFCPKPDAPMLSMASHCFAAGCTACTFLDSEHNHFHPPLGAEQLDALQQVPPKSLALHVRY
jgi:hypothetical protein